MTNLNFSARQIQNLFLGLRQQPREAWPDLEARERVPAALRFAGRRNGRSAVIATDA
jgi:hypothetical protein